MSITHFSGPVALGTSSVESITAAKTLTADDNGKTFIINVAAGATVTLPSVAGGVAKAGYKVEFIIGTNVTSNTFTVTEGASDTNIIVVQAFESDNTAAAAAASSTGCANIIFANAADTVGDGVWLMCDGTNWFAVAHAAADACITVS